MRFCLTYHGFSGECRAKRGARPLQAEVSQPCFSVELLWIKTEEIAPIRERETVALPADLRRADWWWMSTICHDVSPSLANNGWDSERQVRLRSQLVHLHKLGTWMNR